MKRFHVHISVGDLQASIGFYSTLFGQAPSVEQPDYAKWLLDDPRVNFAISTRTGQHGLDHFGIQAEDASELDDIRNRLGQAQLPVASEMDTTCCYARSDKHWTVDPQDIAWESFRTLGSAPTYAGNPALADSTGPAAGCCIPLATGGQSAGQCCVPEPDSACCK